MRMLASEKISENRYKTPEGYLYCKNCVLSRTGKQEYMKCELYPGCTDDSVIEVDRPEKEVFDERAMSSFENKPLCLEHPAEDVCPENYSELAIGHVNNIRRGTYEGQEVMLGDILITDPQAIEMVENGELHDLSCGYNTDLAGDEDAPYQTNIRGNHIALCECGRAGNARIVDSKSGQNKKSNWVSPIKDSISRGSLIQEFGKQGKQYKIAKISGNVIYADELNTGKTVLFKKDEENVEWATITKSEIKDSKTKDAGQLKPEIVQVIKEVLGENINIDYGARGIGNIVIRFKEEKRSPYMQNASLQGVIIALEKAGIKINKNESTVNRYMMEIVADVENSKELTDSVQHMSTEKMLKEKGFEYVSDTHSGIPNGEPDEEIWEYKGTGHFPEVVERINSEFPSLVAFKNSSENIIIIRKKYIVKDDAEYSKKFYRKAINEMEEIKKDLAEQKAPKENKAAYNKHKEKLENMLNKHIQEYKEKEKEAK